MILYDKPIPRYERQLQNVDELVLETIRNKDVFISKKDLQKILESLYEWRVIE
ncbi:hypothetical protein D3C76_1435910 [compost metagenome]